MAKRYSFLISAIGITLLVLSIGSYIYDVPNRQMQQGQWVMHTHEVLGQLEELSVELTRAQVLTTTTPAAELKQRIDGTLNHIQHLTQDNASQQVRIKQLRQAIAGIDTKITEQNIDAMRAEEKQLLETRLASWHEAVARTRLFFLGGLILLYLVMMAAYYAFRKEARAREQVIQSSAQATAVQRALAMRLTQVVSIQQIIASERLNLDNAMQVIIDQTQTITNADGAVVEMYEEGDMFYRAGSGILAPHVGLRLKAEGSLSGTCVAFNSVLMCDDSEIDSRVNREACRKVGIANIG